MPPKLVYLVRHAESAENALMQGVARGVQSIFKLSLPSLDDLKSGVALAGTYLAPANDCQLSDNGVAQIDEVKQMLLGSFVVSVFPTTTLPRPPACFVHPLLDCFQIPVSFLQHPRML